MKNGVIFLARILLAFLFIQAGWGKIFTYDSVSGYMESKGVSGQLLPLVILLELGGGLAIFTGTLTKLTAFSIALFTFISGVLFHFDPSAHTQMVHFYKNMSISGGYLALGVLGGGYTVSTAC
ncbi:DoxX family protein [Vibrio mediterranei]|uniref:DoxX family protein n=1 Tax=Vibrio mediterranei TaxID=689 RepID=UPI0022847346|nr:DoxX family protein [Vibrio mediterranei]MCY9855448.1 DoxX family protein [Vibrio mediterranei]